MNYLTARCLVELTFFGVVRLGCGVWCIGLRGLRCRALVMRRHSVGTCSVRWMQSRVVAPLGVVSCQF